MVVVRGPVLILIRPRRRHAILGIVGHSCLPHRHQVSTRKIGDVDLVDWHWRTPRWRRWRTMGSMPVCGRRPRRRWGYVDSLVFRRRRAADDPDPYVPGGRGQLQWTVLDWTGNLTAGTKGGLGAEGAGRVEGGGRRTKPKGLKLNEDDVARGDRCPVYRGDGAGAALQEENGR